MSMDAPAKINFFKGHPSHRLLPNKAIIDATTQLLTPEVRDYDSDTENRHPLTYGSDEGALWVRKEICKFNNERIFRLGHDSPCLSKPEFLNLNSGASYGVLSILLQTTLAHTNFTKQAFIISPTYFLINDCFIDAGFSGKLTAIDEIPTKNSINFDLLRSKLEHFEKTDSNDTDRNRESGVDCIVNPKKNQQKKIYKYVLYCVPTFANPSGMTFSNETKLELIEIARKYDMLIIADDVYDVLNYEDRIGDTREDYLPSFVPKRFVHLDRETSKNPNSYGNTISNATFSKIIAPGLRFGYHESINQNLAFQLSEGGANISGGTPSQLNSMIVGTLLQNGCADKVIFDLRKTYKKRSEVLYKTIRQYLPSDTTVELMKGGYFTWITLPIGYNMHEIGKRLTEKYQVIMANGSNFEVIGDERDWGETSSRLSISFLEEEDIRQGIKLWGEICREYGAEKQLVF